MPTVATLRGELARIRKQASQHTAPRQWSLCLETGEQIPPVIAAKIRPDDRVCIREYGVNFARLREGEWAYGCVSWHGGAQIVWHDGRLEKVRKL